MKHWETVAIVGVGLIGGSIGLAMRERKLANNVVGIGRRLSSLRDAKRCGAVTRVTTDLAEGVCDADLVVVCTPVSQIVDHICRAAAACPRGCLITDAGSTKSEIVAATHEKLAEDVAFVGSHPLAGSEKNGPLSARSDLFDNRLVIVTPTKDTKKTNVNRIEKFWQSLGATVTRMSPRDHDEAVAAISHLPHIVASALAAATPKAHLPLAATGWQDTTRVASGDVRMWQDIIAQNQGPILNSLDNFDKWLTKFRAAIESGDQTKIAKLLQAGKQNRDTLGS